MILILIFTLLINNVNNSQHSKEEVIIDCNMTFEEAIRGTKAPKEVIDNLILINVRYYSTDNKLHQGQLVIHKDLEQDILEIFDIILNTRFPIAKAIPIIKYNWSDDASMQDNNTSAFCYRNIAGTNRLSNHSFGKAIDINPYFNPVVYPDGKVSPKGAIYDTAKAGTLTESNPVVQAFKERGWRWGKYFSKYADYHHFDKP